MTAYHGKNGLIYISGTQLAEANSWSIQVQTDSVDTPKMGDTWKSRVQGMSGYSGNVTAWDDQSVKIIYNAAVATTSGVSFLIYPSRSNLSNYYSGTAIFGMSTSGGIGAAVNKDGDFVGNGTLTETGWT